MKSLRKTTLKGVLALGKKDKGFLVRLLNNPRKAVTSKGLALSQADWKKLNTLVIKVRRVRRGAAPDLYRYGRRIGVLPAPRKDVVPPWPWPTEWY